MTVNDDAAEAMRCLASRIEDMTAFLALDDDGTDVYDETEMLTVTNGDRGPVDQYGLEWAKDSRDYRHETITYRHVLSTGGPHEEFLVTFDMDRWTVESVVFVYLPWFGREEVHESQFPTGLAYRTAVDFYGRFFAVYAEQEDYSDNERNQR